MALFLTTKLVHGCFLCLFRDSAETPGTRDAVRKNRETGPRRTLAIFVVAALCSALCLTTGALFMANCSPASIHPLPFTARQAWLYSIPAIVGIMLSVSLSVELFLSLLPCSACNIFGFCSFRRKQRHLDADSFHVVGDEDLGSPDGGL
jgi:hypothetical protein